MLIFFYFTQNTKIIHQEFEFSYEHNFEEVTNLNQISLSKIYFSTPSDFQIHLKHLRERYGEEFESLKLVYVVDPNQINTIPKFPKHIGFQENLEELLQDQKEKKHVKIALINAMSNAIGDHMVGMSAFDYWQERVRSILKDSEVHITLFQLNPLKMAAITRQHHPKFQEIYMLPNRTDKLLEHDLFIDFGSLILRENFSNQNMIDFYFEAFSIDPKSVPNERKRNLYTVKKESNDKIKHIFDVIKFQNRPILLFHHKSSDSIRSMNNVRARQYVHDIIKNSNYFVVSACKLEYEDKRYMDISSYSKTLDDFASIISNCDGLITVDTSSYHLADAFNIPTVVLFTTINPDLRIKYYSNTKGFLLEEENGTYYGRHKSSKIPDQLKIEVKDIDKKFKKVDVKDILKCLN